MTPEIVFRVGARRFGLPLSQVREVILTGALSRVPRASPPIAGIMNVRGRVALVVDLGLLLGEAPAQQGSPQERILILDPRRRDLGLWVSEVLSIAQLQEESAAARTAAPAREALLDAEVLSERIGRLFGAAVEGESIPTKGEGRGALG